MARFTQLLFFMSHNTSHSINQNQTIHAVQPRQARSNRWKRAGLLGNRDHRVVLDKDDHCVEHRGAQLLDGGGHKHAGYSHLVDGAGLGVRAEIVGYIS